MGTAMHVSCQNGSVVVRPVTSGEEATATAPPCPAVCAQPQEPVPVSGLPAGGSTQSSMESSWLPVEETPTEASFTVLDDTGTVASEVVGEEQKA